jgi:hypothetical protein
MKKGKTLRIRAAYLDDKLVKIIGRKEEVLTISASSRSGDFINFMIERYPKVFEEFGPGYLGFELNGKMPKALTPLKDGDRYEFIVWTDDEIAKHDAVERLKSMRAGMELSRGELKPPAWMECTWRRIPCGRDECIICGRIKQDRLRNMMKWENSDDMKSAFEDVGNSLAETLRMLKEQMEEAGIELENIGEAEMEEPPRAEEFPLYKKVEEWGRKIRHIAESAEKSQSLWLSIEATDDIIWYSRVIIAKTYRQLRTRWHIDRGGRYGEFDLAYTKYVLEECIKILKQSLAQVSELKSPQKEALISSLHQLSDLEKEIVSI